MTLQIKHLYSETSGNRPTAEQVDVGQLWINAGDSTIGTKKNDGSVIAYAQLTEAERQIARNATPKTGQVSGITMSQVAGATSTDSATIDDNSETVLEGTLTANPFTVTISKTTGHKNTKLVLKKPAGITSSVVWNGADLWLIGDSAPEFGDTQEEQELAVAIFTSPTKTAVNILYNTEHPVEIEATGGGEWGTVEGNLADQKDLQAALDAKADKTSLTSYATKEEVTKAIAENTSIDYTPSNTTDAKASFGITDDNYGSGSGSLTSGISVANTNSGVTSSISAKINDAGENETGMYLANESGESSSVRVLDGQVVFTEKNVSTNLSDLARKLDLTSVYRYRGSVANVSALPQSEQTIGDVYNSEDTGDNYAWTGTAWDKLAGTVDLSNYLTIDSAASTYLTQGNAATTYLGISAKANSAGTADSLSAARTISLTGDATGSVSTNLGANASIAVTLANSGATAGKFGPSANTPVAFGGTFTIPSFTVDAKGRVTKSAQYTITLPSAPTTITGNASTATKLQTPRTITANLGSATGTPFDGSANVNIGVTGKLSVANGGTGASSPAEALTALGGVSNTGGTITGNLTVNGALSGASLNATSDRRLKNIISSASGINLNTLIPYRYTFKNDEKKQVHIGLIAQEVQKIVPEAVTQIDEEGHLGIEYNALVAILIDKINILEKRIAQIENNLQTKSTF